MGYYSDWKLAFTGKPVDIYKFAQWFDKEAEARKVTDPHNYLTSIWHAEKDINPASGYIYLHDDAWKCYEYWDAEVDLIRLKANEFNLESSYGRTGEDYNDIELENGSDHIYMGVCVTITDPEFSRPTCEEEQKELKEYIEHLELKVPPDSKRWKNIVNE